MPILGNTAGQAGKTSGAATITSVTAGSGSVSVTFTEPTYRGKGLVTYTATSSPGGLTATGTSPITVSGLSNGTAYTFTITVTTANGVSTLSSASSSATPPIPQAGYVAGGAVSGGRTNIINKLSFSTETSSNLSSTLSVAINYNASASNSGTAGYTAGGVNSNNDYSRIEKLNFSTETNSDVGSFAEIRYYHTGFANSGTAGYFSGGFNPDNPPYYLSSIKKLTFPGESLSTLSETLTHTNSTLSAGMANSGTAGYISGGTKGEYLNMLGINKLTFSNESISTLSHTYYPDRNSQTSFANSGTAGYFAGGQFRSYGDTYGINQIDKLSFSNDSVSTLGATLSVVNESSGGFAKSGTAGYISGGYGRSTYSYLTSIQKLTFSNDSVSTLAATSNARAFAQGFANSGTL